MSKERAEQIRSMPDNTIDYSDIPPFDESFLTKASVYQKISTDKISIRINHDTLTWFRQQVGANPEIKGYQTLINHELNTYVEHCCFYIFDSSRIVT